jgi:sulfotransferase
MYKKMFFISGLPRSGSTLLSEILSQNKDFHTEGLSSMCQLMWDIHYSSEFLIKENLFANNKFYLKNEIIDFIVKSYYKDIKNKYIFDKNRAWTLNNNFNLITEYLEKDPKIIVMIRDVEEIIKSFVYLYNVSNRDEEIEKIIFLENSEPLMIPLKGVLEAKNNKKNNFYFLDYNVFIKNPKNSLKEIYNFLEVPYFDHDFFNIVDRKIENDIFYNLNNLHEVRKTINKREINIFLTEESVAKSKYYNSLIFD